MRSASSRDRSVDHSSWLWPVCWAAGQVRTRRRSMPQARKSAPLRERAQTSTGGTRGAPLIRNGLMGDMAANLTMGDGGCSGLPRKSGFCCAAEGAERVSAPSREQRTPQRGAGGHPPGRDGPDYGAAQRQRR